MNENQFSALLSVMVPQVIALITQNSNQSEARAVSRFYRSRLYGELSDEKTKLWHFSPLTLYSLYQDELIAGTYDYPEEV
ncbi:MAG: hypothetical protein NC084_07795 [Bacteroides sp.]|nr:hypothetical protein [Eubacterium sp.]MCM1418520.1 hypothetical protein [Roseburia sp.]MCM1462599.1 hypothetical protein [Bacteroides sp.]